MKEAPKVFSLPRINIIEFNLSLAMKCGKGIRASVLKTKRKIWSALTARGPPSRSKNECLRKSASAGVERTARLFSVAETYKKRAVGLRITLKINEQTAVNAIETCWLQSVTGCLGEITGPRTAEHLNKRQHNVFYEDINMPLNYRVRPETDCTPLPKLCIISLYNRTSKPYLLILIK